MDRAADAAPFPTYADMSRTAGWGQGPGAPIAGAATIELVPSIMRYTEGALLGEGGMGKVLLTRDARIGRDVALKQLRDDHELAPGQRERFLREARVQGQLEHPSIVPVYDVEQRADGTTFFTMRRVNGRTLHDVLEALRAGEPAAVARYSQRELLTAFATICLTLDYAHTRGVIHRDLKPANIMFGDFGEVYVLDWGLARILADEPTAPVAASTTRLSMPGEMMGTALYMAPEQMDDPGVGPAADVFALGAVLFEILTLRGLRDPRAPFVPIDARASLRAPHRDIAPELEAICVRATADDPERRPPPRALQEAIVRFLDGDRELAQRRELAAGHAARARALLDDPTDVSEASRTLVIRELRSALALEPSNPAHADALGAVLAQPPRLVPPEVARAMRDDEETMIRGGIFYSTVACAVWFMFLPLVLLMGLRSAAALGAVVAAIGLSAIVAVVATRQRLVGPAVQIVIVGLNFVGMACTSRVFGPLVLVPTLTAGLTVVMQAHPRPQMRAVFASLGVLALVVPLALEVAGVLPPSYQFTGGVVQIVPHLSDLPRSGSIAVLLLGSLGAMLLPSLFIGRLRRELYGAQLRLHLQAWHFRRMGT